MTVITAPGAIISNGVSPGPITEPVLVVGPFYLLLEDGFFLTQEDGFLIEIN